MSVLHVSCAAEGDAYTAHSAAMLHSVLVHAQPLRVHVQYLHGPSFAPAARDAIAAMVERAGGTATFHEVPDEDVAGLPVRGPFTKAMWYRVFLPELLPDTDRVLYLDVDTIATDALAPLWDTDLTGCWLGAVTNVFQRNHRWRPSELGLASAEAYFNSGVLLFNLAEMRRDDCTGRLLAYARAHPEVEWPDQDTLNVVLGSRRLRLHPRWNVMNSILNFRWAKDVLGRRAVREARRSPGIRHFEGPAQNKPWDAGADPRMRELYMTHRRATPWPELELEADPVRRASA